MCIRDWARTITTHSSTIGWLHPQNLVFTTRNFVKDVQLFHKISQYEISSFLIVNFQYENGEKKFFLLLFIKLYIFELQFHGAVRVLYGSCMNQPRMQKSANLFCKAVRSLAWIWQVQKCYHRLGGDSMAPKFATAEVYFCITTAQNWQSCTPKSFTIFYLRDSMP
jgi:hypothetical protein